MPPDKAINYKISSKYAFGAVRNFMILAKYVFRDSQEQNYVVRVCLRNGQALHVSLSYCQSLPAGAARNYMASLRYAFRRAV